MLLGIFGGMGDGKTVYATNYVLHYYVRDGRYDACFANYRITSTDESRPISLLTKEAFKSLKDQTNVLVVMDEAYLWLDSRRSGSKNNVDVSYVVLQSRKRGFDIIFVAQVKSSVDLRLRELADIWVFAERRDDGFHYREVWRGSVPVKMRCRFLPMQTAAKKVFPYFDTREIVSPV